MQLKSIAACALLLLSAAAARSQNTPAPSALKVTVHYSGSGTVDGKHKVYVVLWDTPDFANGGGSMPIGIESVSSKDGSVTFPDVQKTPVYVSTVYDVHGSWDAASGPPEGSPLGVYSKSGGQPAPIDLKAGTTVSVEVPFDDSYKMSGGQ